MKTLAALLTSSLAAAAHAHEGHGMTDSHWHASDSFGFVVLGIAVAIVVWAARRK